MRGRRPTRCPHWHCTGEDVEDARRHMLMDVDTFSVTVTVTVALALLPTYVLPLSPCCRIRVAIREHTKGRCEANHEFDQNSIRRSVSFFFFFKLNLLPRKPFVLTHRGGCCALVLSVLFLHVLYFFALFCYCCWPWSLSYREHSYYTHTHTHTYTHKPTPVCAVLRIGCRTLLCCCR